jgi:hypothetical protein
MKKILAVLLAALFVVSMSTMAFAAATAATVSKAPAKLKYEVGETIDLTGLELTYKDGTEDKTVKFAEEPSNFAVATTNPTAAAGKDKEVKVTYKKDAVDLEATFKIEVVEKQDKTALKIVAPTSASYTVDDAKALEDFQSKLAVTYTDKDGNDETVKYSDNPTAFTVVGFDVSKPGDVNVTVTYKSKSATIKVTVKDVDAAKLVVSKATGVYKVGAKFDGDLTVDYTPKGADKAITVPYSENGPIGIKGFNTSKVAEKVTVTVTYEGLEATYDIAVVEEDRLEKQTIVKDLWSAKNNLDKDPNATIADYVEAYTSVISCYMAADDLDDIAKYVDTQDKVQELVQDSSLYPDNWNEFVKVYTDYIPTAVNQQLDIAARLGWDASDQDFVQDIIDLVKGAAESDATTTEKAADNGGNGGSSSTDANPKTGSTSAIAVFAVLSVAAAAAVVCTKKKED